MSVLILPVVWKKQLSVMADQDSSGPSMGRRNGTPVQCSMKETSVKLAEVQVDLGGRPKAIVVKYEDDDWDLPLLPKKAASNPPKARTRERGDGAGSSKPKAPPAVVSQAKPQMTVVDVCDDVELVLPSVSASSGGKPKASLAVVSQPKPQMTVEVVRDDVELVLPSIFSKSRVNMKDVKAQSTKPVVENHGWGEVLGVLSKVMGVAPKGTASSVIFDQSRKRSRGGSAGTKSTRDFVSSFLEKCIQGFRIPPKDSLYDPRPYFQATKGEGMLAQNVSGTPAQCKGLIAEVLRARCLRLISPSDGKSFFRQVRDNPSVGSGFTLVFALTLERGQEEKTLKKHWRVLACDGDCWTKNEGMKDSRLRNSSGSRRYKDVERLVSADGGSYHTPGLWPPAKGVGECYFLTPVHNLYSQKDVLFLPEHGPHPLKVRDGDVVDEEDFILGSSVIVTSAVGMDSLQCMKLMKEGTYALPIVRSAVTAYSNCVMVLLPRFKQIYPSVEELQKDKKHKDRDFTWEESFCGFRCRELKKDVLKTLINDVDVNVLDILKGDEIQTRDGLSDQALEGLVGRLSYWAKVLFRLEKPKEGETVFMSDLSKQFREKVCKDKRAAFTKLTTDQKKEVEELTECLVNQKPLPRKYTGNVKQSKRPCISKLSGAAGGCTDADESGSNIEEDSEEESDGSKASSASDEFDPADIDESDKEDEDYESSKSPLKDPAKIEKKPASGGKKPEAREVKKNPALRVKKTVKKPEARGRKPSRPTHSSSLRKKAYIQREVAALAQASFHDEDTDDSSAEDMPPIGQQLESLTLAEAMAKAENTKQFLIENPLDLGELKKVVPEAWPEGKPEKEVLELVAQDLATALTLHDIIGAASDKTLICRNETKIPLYNQVACYTQMKRHMDKSRNSGQDQVNATLAQYRDAYAHVQKVRKQANFEENSVIVDALFFNAHALALMHPVEKALDAVVDVLTKEEEAKALAAEPTSAAPEKAAPKAFEYPFFKELSKSILSLESDNPLFKTVETIVKMKDKLPKSHVAQFVFRVCKEKMHEYKESSDEESSDEEASGEESSDE